MMFALIAVNVVCAVGGPPYEIARWEAGAKLATAREGHGMVFLPNVGEAGAVMVAGGYNGGGDLDSVELYDVNRNVWEAGAKMATARQFHGMVFLPSVGEAGAVMVAGGYGGGSLDSVELYDVKRKVWEAGTKLGTARQGHGMVFLPGVGEAGAVMVTGGENSHGGGYLDSVEFYDVNRKVWEAGAKLAVERTFHGMVLLPGAGEKGSVMMAGGSKYGETMDSVELYDVKHKVWKSVMKLETARRYPGMVFLPDVGVQGVVMVAGGSYSPGTLDSVEFSDPTIATTTTESTTTATTTTTTTTTKTFTSTTTTVSTTTTPVSTTSTTSPITHHRHQRHRHNS
jgi:hypothetical protein